MCILLPDGMLFPISSRTDWRAEVFFPINFLRFLYISSRLSRRTNLTIILFLTFFVSGNLCAVEISFTPMSTSMRDPTSTAVPIEWDYPVEHVESQRSRDNHVVNIAAHHQWLPHYHTASPQDLM